MATERTTAYVEAGTYVANDAFGKIPVAQQLEFISNNSDFYEMLLDGNSLAYSYNGIAIPAFNYYSNKWTSEAYKTIALAENQEVTVEFANWFNANFTKQTTGGEEPKAIAIEMASSKGIRLKTQGKICKENIEVVPKLQEKSVSAFVGEAIPDEGYCALSRVSIDLPMLQSATVTPTNKLQKITPESGAFLSEVLVAPIPSPYEIPVYFDADTDIVLDSGEEESSLISFTIDGTSYYAEKDWNWDFWVSDPEYNTIGARFNDYGYIIDADYTHYVADNSGTWVYVTDAIVADANYRWVSVGSRD